MCKFKVATDCLVSVLVKQTLKRSSFEKGRALRVVWTPWWASGVFMQQGMLEGVHVKDGEANHFA